MHYLTTFGARKTFGLRVELTDCEPVISPERVCSRVELHYDTNILGRFRVENHLRPCLALLSPHSGNGRAVACVSVAGNFRGVKSGFKAGQGFRLASEVGGENPQGRCWDVEGDIALLPDRLPMCESREGQQRTWKPGLHCEIQDEPPVENGRIDYFTGDGFLEGVYISLTCSQVQ